MYRVILSTFGIITALLWFHFFDLTRSLSLTDVFLEGTYLMTAIIGYFFILSLNIKALEVGWSLFIYALLIDFLDEFTSEPELWGTTIQGLFETSGVILIVIGLYISQKRLLKELAKSKLTEEALAQTNEKLSAWVEELGQHNYEIALLNKMGDQLQSCQTLEEAYAVIAKSARQLFPAESGTLYMLLDSKNLVEAVTCWGDALPGQRMFAPDGCWALRRRQAHLVKDPRSGQLCQHLSGTPSAYLCVPMMSQNQLLGVFYLQNSPHGRSKRAKSGFTASEQRMATAVAEHIALALANLKLRETLRIESVQDPLTGLFNRRYMERSLERELHRAVRRKASLGVIMLDLDRLKRINDTFGHAAGDILLRRLGVFLRSHIRPEDIACRYGGDEFVLILPEATADIVQERAEKLRQEVKRLNVQHDGQFLGSVSLSIGVAILRDHGSTAEAILRAADAALYRAKSEGGDRVVIG